MKMKSVVSLVPYLISDDYCRICQEVSEPAAEALVNQQQYLLRNAVILCGNG